jgi:hypothetical protein
MVGGPGAPARRSRNAPKAATPATLSAMAWCTFMTRPTRACARPGRNHICHSGRDRSSRRCRSCSQAASSWASPAGAASGNTPTWPAILKAGASTHSGQPGPAAGCTAAGGTGAAGKPAADPLADGLDRETAPRFGQPRAVEDGQRPDVLGPAELLRQHHAHILRTQAFHRASPTLRTNGGHGDALPQRDRPKCHPSLPLAAREASDARSHRRAVLLAEMPC